MKICTICQQEKEENQFFCRIKITKKYGERKHYDNQCKSCKNERVKSRYQSNPELANKRNERAKKQYKDNTEFHRQKSKQWAQNHPEKRREYVKKSMQRPEAKIKRNNRQNERMKTDINFKLKCCLSKRLRQAVKSNGTKKCNKTTNLIGCSIDFLKKHLESKFLPGMTWQNHGKGIGKWEIDHIIPCALFDLTKESEQYKCFHWSNLQPLWGIDNWTKNDLLPNGQRARHLR